MFPKKIKAKKALKKNKSNNSSRTSKPSTLLLLNNFDDPAVLVQIPNKEVRPSLLSLLEKAHGVLINAGGFSNEQTAAAILLFAIFNGVRPKDDKDTEPFVSALKSEYGDDWLSHLRSKKYLARRFDSKPMRGAHIVRLFQTGWIP